MILDNNNKIKFGSKKSSQGNKYIDNFICAAGL